KHRRGRAVRGALSGDQPEQPHPGDRRPRPPGRWWADLHLRIRCDLAVPGREDRQILAAGPPWEIRGHAVAHVADGRPRPDGRTGQSFPYLDAWAERLRGQALYGRMQSALWRDEQASRRSTVSRRRFLDRGHRLLRLGPGP